MTSSPLLFTNALGGKRVSHFTHGKMRLNNLPSVIQPGQGKRPRRPSLPSPLQGSPPHPCHRSSDLQNPGPALGHGSLLTSRHSKLSPSLVPHFPSGSAQMYTGWGSKLPLGESNPRLLTAHGLRTHVLGAPLCAGPVQGAVPLITDPTTPLQGEG